MNVEAFVAESPVERFDEGIVGGLAWPREVDLDSVLVGPQVHGLAAEFAARYHRKAVLVLVLQA